MSPCHFLLNIIYNEVKEIFDNKQRLRVQLEYDKNGREVLRRFGNGTKEETLYNEAALRTIYDGFSFDVIKSGPVFENGTLAAVASSDYGAQYFSTDLLGSVKTSTDSLGTQKASYTYDAFGTLVEGDLTGTTDFGYLGKQHDPTANLYNYGYRDYSPSHARFTTVDPIRDGTNWFSYCNGDPVNFVDLWGLEVGDSSYSWEWHKGYRVINDNGTGPDKTDDRVVTEMIDKNPFKTSESFDSYDEAYEDAQETASKYSFDRTGPVIDYHFDENNSNNNYFEVNIYLNGVPQGNGSTNDSYEVNRWIIKEK